MPRRIPSFSFLLFTAIFLCQTAPADGNTFRLYEDIGQLGVPSLGPFGIHHLRALPAIIFWPSGTEDRTQPDYVHVRHIAQSAIFEGDIICLNIEHWPLFIKDPNQIKQHIEYLTKIVGIVREAQPDAKIGYYGLAPIRDYRTPLTGSPEAARTWRKRNAALQDFADAVDIIFPSLYTFRNNPRDWQKYAIANIEEARQYGKPVIAFLWPQYHGSAPQPLTNRFIDGDFWRLQLETVFRYADGAIIWTPHGKLRTNWDPNAEWVKETILFSKRLKKN